MLCVAYDLYTVKLRKSKMGEHNHYCIAAQWVCHICPKPFRAVSSGPQTPSPSDSRTGSRFRNGGGLPRDCQTSFSDNAWSAPKGINLSEYLRRDNTVYSSAFI
jgi:hypothetical protein